MPRHKNPAILLGNFSLEYKERYEMGSIAPRSKSRVSAASIKRHRTAKLARLITRSYYLRKKGRDDEMYSLVCDEFVLLGGVYIKFLQGVLLQSVIMKRWQSPDRLRIFENLDHEHLDINDILRHELQPDKLASIAIVQPEPFAAGSFGQVYYGQHADGRPIIIKVLRPMVRELLKYDLRLLGAFSKRFAARMKRGMDYNLDRVLADFRTATLRETDYIEEARFARELYETYKGHSLLFIPETFLDLCTSNIIVQEYVPGISAAQLIKLQEQGVDPKGYVLEKLGSDLDEQLIGFGVESIDAVFNLPRIQGDPHPGNVRLMTNNRVGLIDFGISARAPSDRSAFFGIIEEWDKLYEGGQSVASMFEQFMRFFVSDLYRALRKLSTVFQDPRSEDGNFAGEVGKIAQETFSKITGSDDVTSLIKNGKIFGIIGKIVNKDNRFGLVVNIEASEILRTAQTYVTLVDTLGRRATVLPQVFRQVVERVHKTHPELAHESAESPSVGQAIETVSIWLERVAERDPALFTQLMKRIRLGGAPKAKVEVSLPERQKDEEP